MVTRQSARRINFSESVHKVDKKDHGHKFVGISKDYIDHGDPTFECSSCDALLWYAESMGGSTNASSDSYSLCCSRDAYTMIESERMTFNRKNDKDLRSETYSKLATLAQKPNSGVKLRGKKVVLNSSFTRSPRYMMQNYLDAMTLCNFYGYPDLFITFTCNPNWPEISRFMAKRGLKFEDRPDVISRVFKIKLDCLMRELKDDHTFGRVQGVVYTIEFQKRGLMDCHILLWFEPQDKLTMTGKIDQYISAKIPNKDEDPKLYQLVTDHMLHGPCGAENPSSPCTVDYKCNKKFPKQFNESTVIEDNGYGIYKKRNDGSTIKKSGTDLHNGYVVPYNLGLLRRYQAHINVEYCNQLGSIKYLFKYINKGPDRVSATIDGEEVDEIKDYLNCRYLSVCEAAWHIYGFDIHYRTPSVERLPFHLKDEQ
ncbi:ATP-dependent DNA helicase PIF1-like protein [Tanacetum coccineum]